MTEIPGSEVCLNGEWLPRAEARVSVFDRGFIFGDGVYEVIPAYGKRPFLADRHVARLGRSLEKVGIDNPLSGEQWLALIEEIAGRQEFGNQRIYLQVTRGAAPRLHQFPERPEPTYLVFSDEMALAGREAAERGASAITHEDFRWLRGDIKSTSLMAAVLSSEMAASRGATETIFLRDGVLTEGASSNVLVLVGGELRTHGVDNLILGGITMSFIEEVSRDAGHPLAYSEVSEAELRSAEEVIISSSGKEIVAITSLDGETVGAGKAGPVFMKLWDTYRAKTGA